MGIQKTQRDIDNERAEWKDKEREFMDKINSITVRETLNRSLVKSLIFLEIFQLLWK